MAARLSQRTTRPATSMTQRPGSGPSLPGNDGSWFLRAVGGEAPAATLDDVDADSTTEAVAELWKAGLEDALTDWSPDELSRTVERDRRFRWPVVITVGLLTLAVIAVVVWLPTTSEGRADATAKNYSAALIEIRSDLPDTQQVLAVVTEPAADATQFAELIPTVTDLSADADAALAVAAEPLPSPWPLAPDEPFHQIAPFRDAVSAHATSAEAIARRLGDVLDYRSLFSGFMDVGQLPTTASDLNEINTRLATAAADSSLILGELPEDAALDEHRTAAQLFLERFLVWQIDYADALRNDDTELVALLINEFATERANLDALMIEALSTIRGEIDQAIIQLATEIDDTLAGLAAT